MKIRNNFVTNSSSSSFCFFKSEYRPNLSKEEIDKTLKDLIKFYKKYGSESYVTKHDFTDYKIFSGDQIEEITEALHNEFWSASGIKIPDEMHSRFERVGHYLTGNRPTVKELLEDEKFLTDNYGKEKANEIFDFKSIWEKCEKSTQKLVEKCVKNGGKYMEKCDNITVPNEKFAYYDNEFQKAIRADFVVITGENVFPYSFFDLIQDLLGGERDHLG